MVGRFLKSERCSLYRNFEFFRFHYIFPYPTTMYVWFVSASLLLVCQRKETSHRKFITHTDCEIWIDVPVIPHKYTVHSQNRLFQRPIIEFNTRICLDRESLWVPDVYMLLTNPSTRSDLFKIILMPSMVITKRGFNCNTYKPTPMHPKKREFSINELMFWALLGEA